MLGVVLSRLGRLVAGGGVVVRGLEVRGLNGVARKARSLEVQEGRRREKGLDEGL
jgi:hypothetical protein